MYLTREKKYLILNFFKIRNQDFPKFTNNKYELQKDFKRLVLRTFKSDIFIFLSRFYDGKRYILTIKYSSYCNYC